MKYALGIICIIFLVNVNVSSEVQHVSMGSSYVTISKDLVLTIVSVENRMHPILKIENISDEDIEMDIQFCLITLKTKEKEISGSKLSFPIEKIKLGKNSYVVFRVTIERPETELEMAEIFKVQLAGKIKCKNEDRAVSVLGEKTL